MLMIDSAKLNQIERDYPGIRDAILRLDATVLPECPCCGSDDTAVVKCGLVGRSMTMAIATTRLKLQPNGPAPGKYFCHACSEYFD